MDLPDVEITHVFGSLVYMLMPKPIDTLKVLPSSMSLSLSI